MRVSLLRNKIVLTIIMFIAFYALFAAYSDINKIKEVFEGIKWIYLVPILSILMASMFLRSLLQKLLLNAIGIKLSVKQSFLLFLAGLSMIVTPGGAGQMIKSHFIEKKYGHPIHKSLPLVFAERFYDLLSISVIILFTLFLFHSTESLIIIVISTFLLSGIFITLRNKKLLNFINFIVNKIKFLKKVLPQTVEMNNSIGNLFEAKITVKAWIIASLAFFLEGLVIYLCFLSFSIDLGYFQTFQIYYTSVLFGTISLIPGGVGLLEGSFVKLLIQKNFSLVLGTSLIIFIRLMTTWFATAIGFVVTYFTMYKGRIQS